MLMVAKHSGSATIGADLHDIQFGQRLHRHWHYIYKRRRKKAEAISSRQILLGQIIALCGSLGAGYILEINKEHIVLFAGALLLLPGIIDLSASITGAMCAKINHRLETNPNTLNVIGSSILFSMLLTVFAGLIVGLTAGIVGELFFETTFWKVVVLCMASLSTVGLITFPLMSFVTVLVKKAGFDPDNIVGPVETGFSDALMVLTVSIFIKVLI